ncbi:hypothetical protein [Streptosporangium roseum]|uniref:hypothetical protein n=1 Tax=Streptosporangium roseum TaxID=2001 RepID=UPI0033349CB2
MIAASEERDDLHRLVDRLPLNQARALRAVALKLVESEPPPPAETHDRRRRLSFAGIIADEPDRGAAGAGTGPGSRSSVLHHTG